MKPYKEGGDYGPDTQIEFMACKWTEQPDSNIGETIYGFNENKSGRKQRM